MYKIEGWAGEHDECGASIVDEHGKPVCTTPGRHHFNSFTEYYKHAEMVVEKLNHRCYPTLYGRD